MSQGRHWAVAGRLVLTASALWVLSACSNQPVPPDWQLNALDSLQRAQQAYLSGDTRIEAIEFDIARRELAATGRVDLVARAELLRCASRVASLVLEPCAGYEALRTDAATKEQAYAAYLAGQATPAQAELLPGAGRALALALKATPETDPASLLRGAEPLSLLVGAGVALRAGRATPALIELAVDTASQQGWRRPLLAWLGVQALRAEQAGQTELAARARRRMDLITRTAKP